MKQHLEALGLILGFGIMTALVTWAYPNSLYQTGMILGCLGYGAALIAPYLSPNHKIKGLFLSGMISVIFNSLLQTIAYYLNAPLNHVLDGITAVLTPILLYVCAVITFPKHTEPPETTLAASETKKTTALGIIGLTGIVCFFIVFLFQLINAATTDSIRSPWLIIPNGTLLLLGFIYLNIQSLERIQVKHILPVATAISLASIVFIAPIIYSMGFGFDGFLHRASEQVILQTETLQPKPLYYMGQYTLITWLIRLFDFPLKTTDIWFTPFCLLLLIPLALSWKQRDISFYACILFLPFAGLIGSTPQATAYIAGLAAVLFARLTPTVSPLPSLVLSFWSTVIHPLAGLPFFFATLSVLFKDKNILRWMAVTAGIICIPLAFFVLSLRQSTPIVWQFDQLKNGTALTQTIKNWITPPTNHISLWADWSAWYQYLLIPLMLLMAALGYKQHPEKRKEIISLTMLSLGIALCGYLLKLSSQFTFLIDYERQNYIDRLFIIAQCLLVLPAAIGWSHVTIKLKQANPIITFTAMAVFALMGSANAYNAYPKHDATIVGRGWSVGKADFDAVRYIDQDANMETYTVLANQSISAAAVEQLGFKRYADDVFFYPIPTGGSLYQLFLDVTKPNATPTEIQETIKKTSELGKSQLIYIVINDYWWDAERVNANLSSIADKTTPFGNGKTIVYRFKLSTNASIH